MRASGLDGTVPARELPAEQAPATDLDGSLWQLAIATATLSGAAGSGEAAGWLKLAAARLQQLTDTLPPGANVPTRPARQAALHGAQNVGDPTITLVPGGPLIATDIELVTDWLGTPQTPRRLWALCRCGRSGEKPNCDASCLRDGFDDRKDPKRVPDRRDTYQRRCRSRSSTTAGSASTPATAPTASQPCSTPTATRSSLPAEDGWTRSSTPSELAPRARSATPWGAHENRTHVDRDGTRPAAIEITRDGPYRITGAITLVAADGSPVERAEGASNEHYALCRCGQSRNKPYCSGMHWYVGFKDPQPASAANQTIYEAAGGMPALTRMTSIFYEKLAAGDPLLAPLYATIPPSEPERLARELAWLAGAGTDRPEHRGLLPSESCSTITAEARERWVELMCLAAQQARLAEQAEFHATLRANLDLYSRTDTQSDTTRFTWVKRPPAPTERQEDDRAILVELPAAGEPIGFTEHIKPLFRDRDRTSMRFAFDLWSYEEVRANAQGILERVKAGTMPCDGTWPGAWVDVFERWTLSGMNE